MVKNNNREMVKELRIKGFSYGRIAKELHIGEETARYHCIKLGLTGNVVDYGEGVCDVCGIAYEKKSHNQNYCCGKCSAKAHGRERKNVVQEYTLTCSHCGINFLSKYSTTKYCSDRCKKDSRNDKNRKPAVEKKKRYCSICGKELNSKQDKCCSKQCGYEQTRRTNIENGTTNQYGTSKDAESRFADMVRNNYNGMYEYVSGYSGCDGSFVIKCLVCGHEQTRSAVAVRHNLNIECEKCRDIKNENKARLNRESNERRLLLKQIERQIRKIRAKAVIQERKDNSPKYCVICKQCGEEFVSNSSASVYCSKKCSSKHNTATKSFKRRKRIEENGVAEWDISIPKLIKRDKVCQLCGNKVDYKDYKLTPEQYFIAGGNYPSIDHIIPVSKGGTHTWDNVQLAHCRCNTMKNNNTDYVFSKGRMQMNI